MEKLLRQVPLAIIAILVAAGLWYGPITQPAGYHTFADQSAYYDIPHFADVVSNIGFALVAVAGALLLRRRQRHPSLAHSWSGYRLFLVGLFLTALGSTYYHLDPDNGRFHESSYGIFHNGFDRGVMKSYLEDAGFRNIRIETACTMTKKLSGGDHEFSIFIAAAQR